MSVFHTKEMTMGTFDTDFTALGPTNIGFYATGNNTPVGGLFCGSNLGAQGSGAPDGGHFGLVGTVGNGPDWFPAHGSGGVGVFGTSGNGPGVAGTSSNGAGVVGQSGAVYIF